MAKKKSPKPTEIVVVLDRSGSMSAIREDAIGGFNTFLDEQAKEPGECRVSLIQFDNRHDVVFEGQTAARAPRLDETTFIPRGSTALRDAIGRGVGLLAERMAKAKAKTLAVIAILTDGMENASVEIAPQQLKDLLDDCAKKGWGVLYLAAGQDAVAVGRDMGIAGNVSADFAPDHIQGAYVAASSNVRSFRQSGDVASLSFSAVQRSAMATETPPQSFVTTSDAAEVLGISAKTLRRLGEKGEGPPVVRHSPTSQRRYGREDLSHYLKSKAR